MSKIISSLIAALSHYSKNPTNGVYYQIPTVEGVLSYKLDEAFITIKLQKPESTEVFSFPTGLAYDNQITSLIRRITEYKPQECYSIVVHQNQRIFKRRVCKKLMDDIISRGLIWREFPKACKVIVQSGDDENIRLHTLNNNI